MGHLLIVDDEPSICWGLAKLAEELGHSVTTAASAEKGLEAVRARRPDVIVLDVRLPGISGVAAMEQFRADVGARADHYHHGLRRTGHRRRGGAQRGLRVPREAVRPDGGSASDSARLAEHFPAVGGNFPRPACCPAMR